ncbi:MAG: methylated-DNA--[protein]-cysteine S-methyltransferase [Deltaproteobacteria bacterium]|nr:methylated-DNA--[protein]-cysteine S-methyltransferase [Deltaproteobacteria bacterium]
MKRSNTTEKIPFYIAATAQGVEEVRLGGKSRSREASRQTQTVSPSARRWKAKAQKELRSYLSGRTKSFSTPCDLSGLPPFTHAVLKAAIKIPYGEVRSYGWLAKRLGKPKAARAVGNALARNPIPIMIPCHRVVRSDGELGGFALGKALKERLISLEKTHVRRQRKAPS